MIKTETNKICDTLNCRNTKLRFGMGEIFHHQKIPLSALEIQQILKDKGINVNKTSIYRELKFLIKNYLLNEIQIDGVSKYEFNTKNKKSYLMCTKCHQIVPIEVNKKVLEEETKKILQKHKFTVHRHSLIFFGHCDKCQQNHL